MGRDSTLRLWGERSEGLTRRVLHQTAQSELSLVLLFEELPLMVDPHLSMDVSNVFENGCHGM